MNKQTLFSYLRRAPFGGTLTTAQVQGVERTIDTYNRIVSNPDDRHLAYILATQYHETGGRMQPVRETFATSDAQAINRLETAFKAGKLKSVKTPYWRKDKDGKSWFGRGDIQITHKTNYEKMGRMIGVDLVAKPSLALKPEISAEIMIRGMLTGEFTGKRLDQYFNGVVRDPVGARQIVNGKDKAKSIAQIYEFFLAAITKAKEKTTDEPQVSERAALPDDVPAGQSRSLWTILLSIFGGGGLTAAKEVADSGSSLIGAISNPFALIAFLSVLIGGGVLAWLIWTGRIVIKRGDI